MVVVNKKEFNRRFFNDDNTREFLLKHHQVKTQWKENRLKEGINCQRNKEFNQKSIEKDFSTEINIKSDSFDKNRLLTSDKKLLKKEISQTIEINRKINNSTTKNEFYNNKSIDSIYSKKTYKGGYIQDFKTELQGDSFKFSNSLYNNTPSGKSISQFEKNLNISEITKILPKKHYFIKKNSDYDHISSKIKEDSLFKESFIPKEMMKLKAFKKFEEIKENLHYFQEFKGKKKFENISKLELSHKIKKMIQTLQNKTSQNKQKHQKNIDIEIENHVNNVVKQKKHKENTINISNEILTEKKIVKTKEKKQKFLPLKYFANEIHASAQMYLLFPKLQMRIHKKTSSKNSINFLSKEIKIEGRNLSENI